MEEKVKELNVVELYQRINIVKNEIKMKKSSLKENLKLKKKYDKKNTDSGDTVCYLETCRFLLEEDLTKKEQELAELEAIVLGKAPGMKGYFEEAFNRKTKEDVSQNYEALNRGEAGKISGFPIYAPLIKCGFIVRFPDGLGLTESDVIRVMTFKTNIDVTVRNNYINKPLLKLDKLAKSHDNIGNVSVDIIDPTGCLQYTIKYKDCSVESVNFPTLDYSSNEAQKIELSILYKSTEIIDNGTTDKKHSKEDVTE